MTEACLALLGLTALCTRMRVLPVHYAPLGTLCVMALILLAGGLCGVFAQVRLALVCVGLLAGIAAILPASIRRTFLHSWRKGERTALLLFALGLLCLALYYDGVRLAYWDEFFWGGFAKALMHENMFWTWDSVLPKRDAVLLYPPLMTILHALFMPHGVYTELGVAVGGAVPSLILAFIVYRLVRPKYGRVNACILALLCAGLSRTLGTKMAHGYYLVGYAESAQAALFTALALVALFEKVQRFRLRIILLGLPILALCRATGVLLALCVLGCVVAMDYADTPTRRLRHALTTFLSLGTALGLPWLCWKIWQYTHILTPADGIAIQDITKVPAALWGSGLLAYGKAFIARSLLDSPWLGNLNYISSTACICILLLCLAWYLRKHAIPLPQKIGVLILCIGLPAWIGTHIIVFLSYFSQHYILRAASFERFIGVYMACLCVVGLLFWLRTRPRTLLGIRRLRLPLIMALSAFIILTVPPFARPQTLSQSSVRTDIERAADFLTAHTPANSTFWFIHEGTQGEELYALRYLVQPHRRLAGIYDTPQIPPDDVPEVLFAAGEFLPDDLRERAQKYGADYVLLWHYDKALAQRLAPQLGELGPAPVLLRLAQWREGERAFPEPIHHQEVTPNTETSEATEIISIAENLATESETSTALTPAPIPDDVPIEDVIKGTLARGDTLAKILDPWASAEDVRNYMAAFQKLLPLTSLRAGQTYILVCDAETEKLKRFEYEVDQRRSIIVEGVPGQLPEARIETLEYDTRLVMLESQIDDNLFQAVARLNESPQLALLLAGLFGWEINFIRDVHTGDSFRILVEKHYHEGQFKGYGRTLGATFTNKGRTYEAFLFHDAKGRENYYNPKGENLRKTLLQAPLSFTRITSGYGGRRNPFTGHGQNHPAVDYAAPTGTPVKAVGDGVVTLRGWMGGYGNQVVVRHAAGLESMYSHLSAFGRGIGQGSRVRQGQVIAYVGSTGYSTGPHLDFRLKQNGNYINPTKAVNPRSEPLPQTAAPAFRERMAVVRAFTDGSRPLTTYIPAPPQR